MRALKFMMVMGAGLLLTGQLNAATRFSENFDSLTLGPNTQELGLATQDVRSAIWTATGPNGWTVDRSKMPSGGVPEWTGFTFADVNWFGARGGQQRELFDSANSAGGGLGDNVVAIADSDEWDDVAHGDGRFESSLISPSIDLQGAAPNTASIFFEASWRPEGDQTALVEVSYDGGATYTEAFRFSSVAEDPNFQGDAPAGANYFADLNNPAGATNATVRFTYWGTNNWWFAIDEISVEAGSTTLLTENWDSAALGPNVLEGLGTTFPKAFTHTPPTGWNIQNTVPGIGNPAEGMEEWEGWSFVDPAFWVQADNQRRSEFTKGTGVVAVADPDEWDDLGNPDGIGTYNTFLTTKTIDVAGSAANSLVLNVDSSWRPEGNQTATIEVAYNGGAKQVVRKFSSVEGDPNFKNDDSTNDSLSIPLNNPANATSAVITFSMTDAVNNWWWAIDNLKVCDGACDPVGLVGDLNLDGAVDAADAGIMFGNWASTGTGDLNTDGIIDAADAGIMFENWTGDPSTPAAKAATAEYNAETGELKISSAGAVNVFVQSASNAITPVNPAPTVPVGLLTNNTGRVGITNLGPIDVTNFSFGNIGKGLAMSDLKLVYTTALGTKGIEVAAGTDAFKYIPEPASVGLLGMGLISLLAARRRS